MKCFYESATGYVRLYYVKTDLGACHDTRTLDAFDTVGKELASQIWVRAETLPVSAVLRHTTKRTCDWAKLNIRALVAVLGTHRLASSVSETSVPCGSNVDSRWEH